MIREEECVGQTRRSASTASKDPYGRRVVADNVIGKTFAILGASTPEIRISTMGASRKQKVMDLPRKIKTRMASVFKMHNASLPRCALIEPIGRVYVSGNATDRRGFDPGNESTT